MYNAQNYTRIKPYKHIQDCWDFCPNIHALPTSVCLSWQCLIDQEILCWNGTWRFITIGPLAHHTSRSYVWPHLLSHYPAIPEILKVYLYYYISLFKSSDLSQTLNRKMFLPFKDLVMRCTPAAIGSFLKKWEITDILTVIFSGLSNKAR